MFPLILLYLVLTIVRPQDYLPELASVPLLPVVLVLAFGGWLTSSAKTWSAPQLLILPVFLLVLMFSQWANGWAGGMLDQLSRFGPTVIAFMVFAACCTTQSRVWVSMRVFVLCAVVLAVHGVQQARTGVGWTGVQLIEDGRIQYVGIFNDPNDLGLLFVSVLPMACLLGRRRHGLLKWFWYACAALLLYGIYLTKSRGAMLAVLVILGGYLWHRRGLFTAATLGLLGLAVMQLVSSRMNELDAGEDSAAGRVDAWYAGLHMFLSNPVLGVGAGNFTEYNELTAHNSFVLVLAETGFVGYLLWLAFVCYGFWMMLTVLRSKPVPDRLEPPPEWMDERAIALTLLLSQCGMFAAAFFLSRSYMVVLYLLVAMVTGYYVGVRQRFPTLALPSFTLSASGWRFVPAAMGSVVGLFVLVAVLLRTVS